MPPSSLPEEQQPQQQKRPRCWVGPFLAGSCFALGYGLTQRIVTLQSNAVEPSAQAFEASAFPGDSLDGMRLRSGEDGAFDLQVDVKAIEEKREAGEKAKKDAEQLAAEAKRSEGSLQAVLTPPQVEPQPVWTDPTLNTPEPALQPPALQSPDAQPEPQPAVIEPASRPEPTFDPTALPDTMPSDIDLTPPTESSPSIEADTTPVGIPSASPVVIADPDPVADPALFLPIEPPPAVPR